jgi:two-component system response regulator NreC
MNIRVFLVDDHTIFRAGIRALLEGAGDVEIVGEAGTGRGALETLGAQPVDVLLLDVNLPDISGVEVARSLREAPNPPGILVLSMHDDEAYLREFLALGARGYVLKSSTSDELLRAIRAVARGDSHVDPSLSKYLLPEALRKPGADADAALTHREAEVCRLLALGHTNQEVAEALHISRRTVESHRASILGKLRLKTRADLVRYAMEEGLVPR